MKRIKKKRLRKKFHREAISDVVFHWNPSGEQRTKIFQATVGEVFDISPEDLVPHFSFAPGLKKYIFHFSITVLSKSHAQFSDEPWLLEDTDDEYIAIKYHAKEFPSVRCSAVNRKEFW